MRTIAAPLAAHLAGDATTTCHAWRVLRRDGAVLGFTDHDADLWVAGTLCRAASGFAASEDETGQGFAAASGEVAGGFSSEAIRPEDLSAGHYDGARVELYLVNWADPAQAALLALREIGEVMRAGERFSAELRSIAHRLDQPQGRLYNRRCDAELGDSRCRVDLTGWRAAGTVMAVEDRSHVRLSGLHAFAEGFFDGGTLELGGRRHVIDRHRLPGDGSARLTLWLPLEEVPASGAACTITAGCDKRFATCKVRFGNGLNFRGFPHVPGTDFSYSYADGERLHDGGPIFE